MANELYTKAKESLLNGEFSLNTDNLKVVLADSADYTVNISTDQFLNDIPAPARVATSGNLLSVTTTNGVLDAADVTFSAVSGDQSELVIIYQDTGVETTSRLLAKIDTATGLPVTPNGGDITISWNASGIVSL